MYCWVDLQKVGLDITSLICWGMGYADNIKLLCPSLNDMQQRVEYNIKFNSSKSCMFLFKCKQCKDSQRTLIIDGVTIHCSESVSDLGHNVSTNDKDSITVVIKY